jgi:hypothetical protein
VCVPVTLSLVTAFVVYTVALPALPLAVTITTFARFVIITMHCYTAPVPTIVALFLYVHTSPVRFALSTRLTSLTLLFNLTFFLFVALIALVFPLITAVLTAPIFLLHPLLIILPNVMFFALALFFLPLPLCVLALVLLADLVSIRVAFDSLSFLVTLTTVTVFSIAFPRITMSTITISILFPLHSDVAVFMFPPLIMATTNFPAIPVKIRACVLFVPLFLAFGAFALASLALFLPPSLLIFTIALLVTVTLQSSVNAGEVMVTVTVAFSLPLAPLTLLALDPLFP